jgi:plasmid stabilization system protein ParE
MKIRFLKEAQREFLAAISYYDRQEKGLGQRFAAEIDRAVLWLTKHPLTCPLRRGIYRRLNLSVFPYYIAYVVRESTLWIVGSLIRDVSLNTGLRGQMSKISVFD